MLRRIFVSTGMLLSLTLGIVRADNYAPPPDCRIADPEGRYYVVWKRSKGEKPAGEWCPMEFTIAERAPDSPPVTLAESFAFVGSLDQFDPARADRQYRTLENAQVTVRAGDVVRGRGLFQVPPRVVLVSSRGLGFVTLDVYGPNLPIVCNGRGGHAVVVVSLDGKVRHAMKLSALFSPEEIRRFWSNGVTISWLRGGWINEQEEELVLNGGNNELRVVNLVSGEVRHGERTDVVRGLTSADPEAVKQALILAADRKFPTALEPAHEILVDPQARPDVRLRAAVLLAVLGDRRGAERIRQTAAGKQPEIETAQAWDRQFQRAIAVEYLPEALGSAALPLLADAVRGQRAEQSAAFKALVKLEGESLPLLIPMLSPERDRSLRLLAIGILGSLGPQAKAALPELVKTLEDADPLVRVKAAFAMTHVDPTHQAVLPGLRAGLHFDEPEAAHFPVREAAVESLALLGPGGTSVLVKALSDQDAAVRKAVASALWQRDEVAAAMVPALVEALGDNHKEVRAAALETLVKIGPEALPVLVSGLQNENARVRSGAAFILGRIGPAARSAIPALETALADQDPLVESTAAAALSQVDPQNTSGVATLIELLGHSHEYIRAKAAVSLGQFGPRAGPAIGPLLKALDDRDKVAEQAALALGKIGPEAAEAVDHLIEALDHPNRLVRRAAVESLGRFGPAGAKAVPSLIDSLQDPDWHVPHLAATALGRIGPKASQAAATLTRIVEDNRRDTELRIASIEALGKFGSEAQRAIPALIEALADACPEVAGEAVKSLAAFAPGAVPGLIQTLGTPTGYVRLNAAEALGLIGPHAEPAVPALIEALAHADAATGYYSEEPLMRIGPAAVGHLVNALRSEDEDVRARAAQILGRFGPEAKEAVAPLAAALNDSDPYVRRAAAAALKRIDE